MKINKKVFLGVCLILIFICVFIFAKNVYKKGYHVTEACVLTTGNHPVSIFSKVHSSAEKGYKSTNTVTFEAMNEVRLFLKKQLSAWIVVMMTIRCS